MTTTTTERDAALARLREVVKPGDTVYAILCGTTRAGAHKVRFFTPDHARLTALIVVGAGLPYVGLHEYAKTYDARTTWLVALLDRLSVALFGEPGQIKGEYL